jgi:cytochrome c-type biogenesis protein CcmH/NrfG
MTRDSLVFAVAGTFFGLLVGWMIGSQQGSAPRPGADPAEAGRAAQPAAQAPAALDEAKVRALRETADRNPGDAATRAMLGNLYFDAERYDDAIKWYEESLRVDARNPNVSTDLGVSYYYVNQPDRALKQFEHSLSVDPAHTKTLLNVGIVRAFGKQDLAGAAAAWQRVLELAPDTPEGKAARQALDNMRAAHPDTGAAGPPPPRGSVP